jgi:hypothetical protein
VIAQSCSASDLGNGLILVERHLQSSLINLGFSGLLSVDLAFLR